MKKNLIVGQSGGPTAVINGSLYGAVSEALFSKDSIDKVYGMCNGIEGFLKGNVIDMAPLKEDGTLDIIKTTPAAYLGSCRYKLPEDSMDPVYDELFAKMEEYNIGYFMYIGGNDSMDTVSKLSAQAARRGSDIRFMGLPKTIDNDLVCTDHTPGFGSAAKFVAEALREITIDACVYGTTKSVTVVEIMGRHAGWLTAASVLARCEGNPEPSLIYLPERDFDVEDFLTRVSGCLEKKNNIVVAISEGIHDKNGTFICEYSQGDVGIDQFGHKSLSGSGKFLENLIKERLGVKVRSVELNVLQRCASSMLSASDLSEAIESGRVAVRTALKGGTGKMIGFKRCDNNGYYVEYVPVDVHEVCNKEKKVPDNMISEDGADITEAFVDYALPLIQGEVALPRKNSLPLFAIR